MNRVNHNGIYIHYQVTGKGPPLVLHHGFSDDLRSWYEYGYVAALAPHYRLILIDSRGHGRSDKPHTATTYTQRARSYDVLAVLDALQQGETIAARMLDFLALVRQQTAVSLCHSPSPKTIHCGMLNKRS